MKNNITRHRIMLFAIAAMAASVAFAQTERMVCDETCETEFHKAGETVKGDGFAVVSPVGRSTVKMIDQAPRLTTLDGKTIAVVGVSFMTKVTHPEIKRLILKHYPTARVILLDEIGAAGVYPAPGIIRRSVEEEANICIGRFLNLALMNLAGYYVKQDRMGTFGYLMPWCLVEDEEAYKRIGWQPYHVRKGFKADESTITVSSTLLWGNNMAPSTTDAKRVMQLMAWDISERCQFALGSGKQFTYRTILLTEPVARILAQKYSSPEALEDALITSSRRPLKERAFANYYANPGGAKDGGEHNLRQYTGHLRRTEGAKETPTPEWYDSPESTLTTIPTMEPGMTAIIITGDASRNKVQIMPGGSYATEKIDSFRKL